MKTTLATRLTGIALISFLAACGSNGATGGLGFTNGPGGNGGNGTAGVWTLTDMDGAPIANVFWSAIGAGGSSRVSSTYIGFTDDEGDSCNDPDTNTPQTSDDSADADGCTDSNGQIEIECSGDFTLTLDDGAGHVVSQTISCDSEDTAPTVSFEDYSSEVNVIFIWDAGQDFAANLGNRAATSDICIVSAPERTVPSTAKAFLSYVGDALVNFPANYGLASDLTIMATNGANIAADWASLFNSDWIQSASSAGITNSEYWTGTYLYGSSISVNCEQWTNNTDTPLGSVSLTGYIGDPNATDSGAYGYTAAPCTTTKRLLCVAEGDWPDNAH